MYCLSSCWYEIAVIRQYSAASIFFPFCFRPGVLPDICQHPAVAEALWFQASDKLIFLIWMCYFAFHLLTSAQSRRHESHFFKYAVKSVAVTCRYKRLAASAWMRSENVSRDSDGHYLNCWIICVGLAPAQITFKTQLKWTEISSYQSDILL